MNKEWEQYRTVITIPCSGTRDQRFTTNRGTLFIIEMVNLVMPDGSKYNHLVYEKLSFYINDKFYGDMPLFSLPFDLKPHPLLIQPTDTWWIAGNLAIRKPTLPMVALTILDMRRL